jgi:hypothetical protein
LPRPPSSALNEQPRVVRLNIVQLNMNNRSMGCTWPAMLDRAGRIDRTNMRSASFSQWFRHQTPTLGGRPAKASTPVVVVQLMEMDNGEQHVNNTRPRPGPRENREIPCLARPFQGRPRLNISLASCRGGFF